MRRGINLGVLLAPVNKPLKLLAPDMLVAKLRSAEYDVELHIIALLQELYGPLELEIDVVYVSIGSYAYRLKFDVPGLLSGFPSLLLLLVAELAVVHYATDWWLSIGSQLDQIRGKGGAASFQAAEVYFR